MRGLVRAALAVLVVAALATASASRLDVTATGPASFGVGACAATDEVLVARPEAAGTVVVTGLSPGDLASCAGTDAALTLLTGGSTVVARGPVTADGVLLRLDGPVEPPAVVDDAVLDLGGLGFAVRWDAPALRDPGCTLLDAPGDATCRVLVEVQGWPGWWQARVTVRTDSPEPVRWQARLDLAADPIPFRTTDVGEYTGNVVLAAPADCAERVLTLVGVAQRSETVAAGRDVTFQLVGTDGDTHAAQELLRCPA